MPSSFKPFLIRAVMVYVLLCISYYFFQHLFFFHPKKLPEGYQFSFTQKFEEQQILLAEKTLIDIVQFKPSGPAGKGVVLYFHGNRNNIELYAQYATNFTKHDYQCWMVDYPGYGKSTGERTTATMQQAAEQLYKMARAQFPKDNIIIYGKSLGTGPAAWLASVRDCKALILETPYYSLASLASRYAPFMPVQPLIKVNFTTGIYLKTVTAPITIFHGLQDEVIPFTNAMRLLPLLKHGDQFVPIAGGKHNNLPSKAMFQAVLDNLLSEK